MTSEQLEQLKSLCAAYEAALHFDYCPNPSEAAEIVEEIETDFTAEHFRNGAINNQGRRPDEIANSIISFVGSLK